MFALFALAFPASLSMAQHHHHAHHNVIGPGANFSIHWTPDFRTRTLDMCFGCDGDGSSEWVALGFSKGAHQMNFSDIVLGYMSNGRAKVETLYSLGKNGYPSGSPTLKIEHAEFHSYDGRMEVCFSREFDSGHNPITDEGRVIWAHGPVSSGKVTYHGADGHDDTGKSQTHRSDETNPIRWLTGNTACKRTEYCCPDAKHCLTPTKTSCAKDPTVCSADQACCPLTKVCVDVGAPCVTPCADLSSYCCPDAKHCLTPVKPGTFCTGPGTQGSCDAGQVCCPVTNECVTVGTACTPP